MANICQAMGRLLTTAVSCFRPEGASRELGLNVALNQLIEQTEARITELRAAGHDNQVREIIKKHDFQPMKYQIHTSMDQFVMIAKEISSLYLQHASQ